MTEPLSPEEDALQAELSQRSRDDLIHICKVLADKLELNTENTSIMLSGGAESLCVLWSLLSIGVRPSVISWTGGKDKESLDFRKAKKVAEFYDLPFHAITAECEPDVYCEHVVDALTNHGMTTRPDFEVSWLYRAAYDKANEIGTKYVISGIGEGNQMSLGRKLETAGRQGRSSVAYRSMNHSMTIVNKQVFGLIRMARDSGIRLLVPAMYWGAIAQFDHLPFRLLNIPRNKIIFWRAFQPDIDECGVPIHVSSMQTGDASARDGIEKAVSTSAFAKQYVADHGGDPEKHTRTSQVWYNFIKKANEVAIPTGSSLSVDQRDQKVIEAWSSWFFTGTPLPQRARDLGADEKQAVYFERDMENDDLFAVEDLNGDEREWIDPDEDSMPETLGYTDCFGLPLSNEVSMHSCPRARAGLCLPGKHHETPYDTRLCQTHRDAIDYGLLAVFRTASFHQRVGFKELVDPILDIYSYVARRNQEGVDEAVRALRPSDGTELYPGAPLPPGSWMTRDGSPMEPIGSFDDIPSVSADLVDRDQFIIDTSDED